MCGAPSKGAPCPLILLLPAQPGLRPHPADDISQGYGDRQLLTDAALTVAANQIRENGVAKSTPLRSGQAERLSGRTRDAIPGHSRGADRLPAHQLRELRQLLRVCQGRADRDDAGAGIQKFGRIA